MTTHLSKMATSLFLLLALSACALVASQGACPAEDNGNLVPENGFCPELTISQSVMTDANGDVRFSTLSCLV